MRKITECVVIKGYLKLDGTKKCSAGVGCGGWGWEWADGQAIKWHFANVNNNWICALCDVSSPWNAILICVNVCVCAWILMRNSITQMNANADIALNFATHLTPCRRDARTIKQQIHGWAYLRLEKVLVMGRRKAVVSFLDSPPYINWAEGNPTNSSRAPLPYKCGCESMLF